MKRPLTFLLFLALLVLFGNSSSTFAKDFQDGMSPYNERDYKTALKIFLSNAEQGLCCRSQVMLGLMYEEGQGTPQNHKESIKWYRDAAQYEPEARFILGKKYHEGEGVPQNYKVAVKWYQLAVDLGHKNAKSNLLALAIKSPEALELLITDAENGNPESQYHLGLIYSKVTGLQDYVLAHQWFNLASSRGNQYAEKNLNLIENKMTPQQIEDAQEMARSWKPTSKLIILWRNVWKRLKYKTGLEFWMIKSM